MSVPNFIAIHTNEIFQCGPKCWPDRVLLSATSYVAMAWFIPLKTVCFAVKADTEILLGIERKDTQMSFIAAN